MLTVEQDGAVAIVRIVRPQKRNALDDATVLELERAFTSLPPDIGAAVLAGEGEHFCAGLDLGELVARDAAAGMAHSRLWHRAFAAIEFGPVPVIAALAGAVIGGGLELAAACHLRVADATVFYALPEGSRGIYTGGGASVRLPRLIGLQRMRDMMLTGRTFGAEAGLELGFCDYLAPAGEALALARSLAHKVAANAPLTNFALVHALPRIAEAGGDAGYLLEALMAAVAQATPEAKARLEAFLAGRAAKVERPDG